MPELNLHFYDERMINYFFKDPDFINRASKQYITEREHLNWLLTYDRTAIESYIKIYKYLDSLGMKGSDSIRFEFDPNDYKHYLGKYKAKWCSDKDFVFDDSVTVTLEEGKLIWNGYRSDGPNTRKEIIPINRNNFRDNGLGVYHLEFDDKGDVEGIWFSTPPPLWIYSLEKIR